LRLEILANESKKEDSLNVRIRTATDAPEAPDRGGRSVEPPEDPHTAPNDDDQTRVSKPVLRKKKDGPMVECAVENTRSRNKRLKGQEPTRRSERIRDIKAKEAATPGPAENRGAKRKRVEQVKPNVEKKKIRKECHQEDAEVQELAEKEGSEPMDGDAENDKPVPKKKGRAPTRGKRKRDDDVEGGVVAKRSKVAEPEPGEADKDDGAKEEIPKKVRVLREGGALGKRVPEDTSEPVEGFKRVKATTAGVDRIGQQSHDSGSLDEEHHQEDVIDLTASPKRKVAFEGLDQQSGSGTVSRKRKCGNAANNTDNSKRPCIDQLQKTM
jgi:hypothetical protein